MGRNQFVFIRVLTVVFSLGTILFAVLNLLDKGN